MLDDDDEEDDGIREEETETKPLEGPGLAELGLHAMPPHSQTTLLTRGAEQGPGSEGGWSPCRGRLQVGTVNIVRD